MTLERRANPRGQKPRPRLELAYILAVCAAGLIAWWVVLSLLK